MASLTSILFKAARTAATVQSLSSPKRASRRAKNIIVGRALAKGGFWRSLWK